ncbi:MAG TPA: hypothetical protein VNG53_07255 [Bacteroidia bacterium]|nr:hypothetical protein [Bacteroidia bacterium]
MKSNKKYLPNRKFILGQKLKEPDPAVEIMVLTDMLKQAEVEKNYEFAEVVFRRICKIKSSET